MAIPFGGLPTRFDPASGPSMRRCLVVPGVGYSPAGPLLEFGRQALLQHGWSVRQLWWDVPRQQTEDDRQRWVVDRVGAEVAEEQSLLPQPERWLIMAKSLGTLAVCSGLPATMYILFTPLLTNEHLVSRIHDAVHDNVPVLLVGGTADDLWSGSTAGRLGCEVVEIEGADHAMAMPGDAVATAQVHAEVALAVERFLTALS
jgi:alpha-beta hydrolase superfamily lysophospholipase